MVPFLTKIQQIQSIDLTKNLLIKGCSMPCCLIKEYASALLVIGKTSDTTILIYFNTKFFSSSRLFRMYLPLKVIENILQFNQVRKLDQQVNQPKNGLLEGKFNMTFLHIFTQLLCRRQVEDKPLQLIYKQQQLTETLLEQLSNYRHIS